MARIGYLRVSTDEQTEARQIDGLEAICDELHVERISGGSTKRPVYERVLKKLRTGDTFVVWDLDRAFRSTIEAILVAEKLQRRGIEFQICTLKIDTSEPAGELFYTIMAAYGQFERRNLSRRTKEGMAAAKRRGKHVGRPRILQPNEVAEIKKANSDGTTFAQLASKYGVSINTIKRILNTNRD